MFSFDLPPHPPTTKEDDLSVLRLIRSRRVGPATFHRLIAEHGSAAAALDALPAIAAAAGIAGYAPCPPGVAAAELAAGARAGARLIRYDSPDYPVLLSHIADAPPVLWARGSLEAAHRPVIAVIGSRNASSLGLRMARGLARALAEAGVTVAAGLARGIDTAAHEASCAVGTIAVMAGGIDVIYPAENRALAERICETGCLLTEQPPGVGPVARHFPARNRIVSGLCAGVVVVEAAHRSGTLITARTAGEQGREVMAVPGHPLDTRASGCNALIRDGATLVRNAQDVLAAVGLSPDLLRAQGSGSRHGPSDRRGATDAQAGAAGAGTGAAATDAEAAADRSRQRPPREGRPRDRLARGSGGGAAASCGGRSEGELSEGELSAGSDASCAAGAGARAADHCPPADENHFHAHPPPGAVGAPCGPSQPRPPQPSLESRVLALLGPSPTDEDQLLRDLGIGAAMLAPVLLDLELDGRLIRMAGARLALA